MNAKQSCHLAHLYDSQIDAHLAQIRILRERRNADCSHTRRLPQEIMSKIFNILRNSCYGTLYPHLEWKAVTHVCRTWRNGALSEPTLWTDFTHVHPKWVREIFTRSKAAPLRLFYGDYRCPSDALDIIVDALIKSPQRIKELQVFQYAERSESFITHLVKPAPFLESLVVELGTLVEFPPGLPWWGRTTTALYQMHWEPAARSELAGKPRESGLLWSIAYPSKLVIKANVFAS